jgi:tetraprenyl-beta-curcumene synthase
MASIRMKKFHCQGGSIYSLYPGCDIDNMIKLIVALQNISDYLDNLCDRTETKDENSFRQLHLAFTDALQPEMSIHDYYSLYPHKEDGGYLNKLVTTCRECIGKLPAYELAKPHAIKLGRLYSELQIYKHLDMDIREKKVIEWSQQNMKEYPDITNWEFAAATGSTLGIFMLFASASDKRCTTKTIDAIMKSYFPWICGLHILLDYYIDLEEDKEFEDLNFISYYTSIEKCNKRLNIFTNEAMKNAKQLPIRIFHKTVIQGLLAMYLSDPKALQGKQEAMSQSLVKAGGPEAVVLWKICKYLRKKNVL